jgi:hypothetical protein
LTWSSPRARLLQHIQLLVEISRIFLDSNGVRRTRGDTAHTADAFLHMRHLDPIPGVLIDPPGTDAHACLTICALIVIDSYIMQLGRLPSERRR